MVSYEPKEAQPLSFQLRPGGSFVGTLRDETGSQTVELGLVLIPLLGFVFLILDICWVCFAQETLQHAVQMGVRSAITGTAQTDAIKTVVQNNASFFLPADLSYIQVQCYDPTNLTPAPSCTGGYVVEVEVNKVPVSLLGPVIGTNLTNVTLSANSSDIMESNPVPQ